jgi:hypothetical protein
MGLQGYTIYFPKDRESFNAREPRWPKKDMFALMQEAFRDTFIADLEHPIIKGLQGRL